MAADGYTNPELLAETDWLAEHLDDPNIRIVDCEPYDAYRRAHIQGAVGIQVHPYIKDPNNPRVMDADDFAKIASELGIATTAWSSPTIAAGAERVPLLVGAQLLRAH